MPLLLALWELNEGVLCADVLANKLQELGLSWYRHGSSRYVYGELAGQVVDKERILRLALPLVRHYSCAVYLTNIPSSSIRYAFCDLDGTLLRAELLTLLAEGMPYELKMVEEVVRSMSGEIAFATSFMGRTRLLRGVPVARLIEVISSVDLAPGLETLLTQWKLAGIGCELVTGNYQIFAEWMVRRLGLGGYIATHVETKGDELTGELLGKIVDAEAKARFLRERVAALDLESSVALAIGDGANDLAMLTTAGHALLYCSTSGLGEPLSLYEIYRDINALKAVRI